MARAYRMTSARRAAIKKAQRISAQKRRGKHRKKIAAGVVGVGVIGVTMYAANGYRKRGKGGKGPVNVVSQTMAATPSASKELDLIRINALDAIHTGIDYGEVGKPRTDSTLKLRQDHRQQQNKLNRNVRGRGRVRNGSAGTDKVKRNRPKFNDDRRNNYDSKARKAAYDANPEPMRTANRERARRNALNKRLKKLFGQPVLGGISVSAPEGIIISGNSRGSKSTWPLG